MWRWVCFKRKACETQTYMLPHSVSDAFSAVVCVQILCRVTMCVSPSRHVAVNPGNLCLTASPQSCPVRNRPTRLRMFRKLGLTSFLSVVSLSSPAFSFSWCRYLPLTLMFKNSQYTSSIMLYASMTSHTHWRLKKVNFSYRFSLHCAIFRPQLPQLPLSSFLISQKSLRSH